MKWERLAWVTDPHVNFVSFNRYEQFVDSIAATGPDALLLTGDLSEAEDLTWQLERLQESVKVPLVFILGNHDFYSGSIDQVRESVASLAARNPHLHYLTGHPPIVGNDWAICGDDGWADTREGDFFRSPIRMNDFRAIEEFRKLSQIALRKRLRREGAAAALRLYRQLMSLPDSLAHLLVLTHPPPFREACWYDGQFSDDDWAPFFCCRSTGWVLRKYCATHPRTQVHALCGHTHSPGVSRILENLVVSTGGAEYGEPDVAGVIDAVRWPVPVPDWSATNGHN